MLISGDPRLIRWIEDGDFLVVDVFRFKEFCRRLLVSFNKVEDTGTAQSRNHQRCPDKSIFTRQRLRRWRTEGSGQGCGGHRVGGGGHRADLLKVRRRRQDAAVAADWRLDRDCGGGGD
jgi:hypothetical protein